jgi:hypothetical protein
MPKPPSPPPRKQRVLNFVSPKVADIIFYELRDGRLPQYKTTPAYGTAHPDKRKYPNHKLVFVTPATASEDGWQKWYYAASRESQDDYNFEIDGDERLTRTYIYPRADYLLDTYKTSVKPAVGTVDTKFTDFQFQEEDIRRTSDKIIDSYFVVIQRVFVNPNKIVAASESGTARGETGTETTLGTYQTAHAVSPGIVLQRSSRLTEYDLWNNTESRLALRAGVNNTATTQRVGYTETSTSELSLTEPPNSSDPSFNKRLVTTDADGQDAIWACNKSTRASKPANGSEMVTFLGGGIADIDVRLVTDLATADSGFYVIGSAVSPLGNGDAIKTTKTIGSYPTLVEHRYDSQLDAMLTITKTVIVPGSATGSKVSGTVTEIKPVDKWRSVQVVTSASGVERTEIIPGVFNFRVPPVLNRCGFYYTYAYAGFGGNYQQDRDVSLLFEVTESYTEAVRGQTRRIITSSLEGVYEENPVVNFKPQSHTINWLSAYSYADAKNVWAKANVRAWQTPMALCPGLTIETPPFFPRDELNAFAVDDQYTSKIPATSPAGLPVAGTLMTIDIQTRKLKLGYWEVLIKEIFSPG